MENWKPIAGTGNMYMVSNLGSVKGPKKLLKPSPDRSGYLYVGIKTEAGYKRSAIARLVALTFLPPPDDSAKKEVNHKNFDKANNSVDNLEWVTKQENLRHARDGGRYKPTKAPPIKKKLATVNTTEKSALMAEATPENMLAKRKELRMSQKEVASAMDVNTRTYLRWENGEIKVPLMAWAYLKHEHCIKHHQ